MSHMAKVELEIKDLTILKKACERMGFTFIKDKKNYEWFGKFMNDTPLPEGVQVKDLGHCDHAISVPGCKYEVGVVKKGNHHELIWDYWGSGGLDKKIGKNGGLLKQAYTIEKAKMECIRKGYSVREQRTPQGIQLRVEVR